MAPPASKPQAQEALVAAIRANSPEGIRLALQGGALLAPRSKEYPLHFAASLGHLAAVETLIQELNRQRPDRTGKWQHQLYSAADAAIEKGQMQCLLRILQEPFNRNGLGGNRTLLQMAATKNNLPALRALVQAGADINQFSPVWQMHALEWAIYHGNFDAARLLIKLGAKVVHVIPGQSAPFSFAVGQLCRVAPEKTTPWRRRRMLATLLNLGAPLNAFNPITEQYPLGEALRASSLEGARLLFNGGVRLTDVATSDGLTGEELCNHLELREVTQAWRQWEHEAALAQVPRPSVKRRARL